MTTIRLRLLGALILCTLGLGGCADGEGETMAAAADDHADEAAHGDAHGDEHDEHAGEEGRVELTEAALENGGIVVAPVQSRDVAAGPTGATVPGQVEFDPARVTLVSPRTSGRLERLTAVEGDQVRGGQPLAYVLSPAFLTAQSDFVHALRRAEMLAGTGDEEGARALAEAARRRLLLLGASEGMIGRLVNGEAPLDLIPITAPFGGSIVEAHTLTGAALEAGSPIFTLADLSVVNVVAEVPERSLGQLRRGQTARVALSAYPGAPVEGTVERIAEALDAETRTARAILRVPNPRGLLRPGMFATVRLGAAADGPRVTRPVVPEAAVVTDGTERYVFVEVEPGAFERRSVEVEALGDGGLVVLSGLAAGERVVVEGAFTLKSELAKGEFGGHHH